MASQSTSLYHLVPVEDLKRCQKKRIDYYPRTYDQDGFTHLTADPQLLLSVANQFYRDSEGDWLLLVIDAQKLSSQVKFEPAAPVGDKPAKELKPGEQALVFPHLYGGINIDAITAELPIQRDNDGKFIAIEWL